MLFLLFLFMFSDVKSGSILTPLDSIIKNIPVLNSTVDGLPIKNPVCKPNSTDKNEIFDNIASSLFAFGDPCHPFPTDAATATSLCSSYRKMIEEVDGLIKPSPWLAKNFNITSVYNFTAQAFCELYYKNATQMIAFALEANSKSQDMAQVRRNMVNIMYYPEQELFGYYICSTPIGIPMLTCYFYRWFNETINTLSEPSKDIAIKINQNYLDIVKNFKPPPPNACPWILPALTQQKYLSFDLNYLYASYECFKAFN